VSLKLELSSNSKLDINSLRRVLKEGIEGYVNNPEQFIVSCVPSTYPSFSNTPTIPPTNVPTLPPSLEPSESKNPSKSPSLAPTITYLPSSFPTTLKESFQFVYQTEYNITSACVNEQLNNLTLKNIQNSLECSSEYSNGECPPYTKLEVQIDVDPIGKLCFE